jgi:hypothetical protein
MTEQVNKTEAEGEGDSPETVESLKSKLSELEGVNKTLSDEATKNKHLRRTAEKERDELKKAKKTTESSDEDYKKLWSEANDKLTKATERAKKSDINTALAEQFAKTKVAGDKIAAAMKLVDHSLIEWDEDAGVETQSVTAAVQKLKKEHSFLFETIVGKTDVKNPGDAGGKNKITRSEFDLLTPQEKRAKVKDKVTITD